MMNFFRLLSASILLALGVITTKVGPLSAQNLSLDSTSVIGTQHFGGNAFAESNNLVRIFGTGMIDYDNNETFYDVNAFYLENSHEILLLLSQVISRQNNTPKFEVIDAQTIPATGVDMYDATSGNPIQGGEYGFLSTCFAGNNYVAEIFTLARLEPGMVTEFREVWRVNYDTAKLEEQNGTGVNCELFGE